MVTECDQRRFYYETIVFDGEMGMSGAFFHKKALVRESATSKIRADLSVPHTDRNWHVSFVSLFDTENSTESP